MSYVQYKRNTGKYYNPPVGANRGGPGKYRSKRYTPKQLLYNKSTRGNKSHLAAPYKSGSKHAFAVHAFYKIHPLIRAAIHKVGALRKRGKPWKKS